MRTIWHCHIAVSLDGLIAKPDGSVDWLAAYPAEDFGIDTFPASVDTIPMGRATCEAVHRLGDWPCAGKPTVVAPSRTSPAPPDGVEARSGELGAIVAEPERRRPEQVRIGGGGQIVRGMLALGRLDVPEMALIPVVLGDGIRLFPAGTPETTLRLVRCEAEPRSALHLVCERAA